MKGRPKGTESLSELIDSLNLNGDIDPQVIIKARAIKTVDGFFKETNPIWQLEALQKKKAEIEKEFRQALAERYEADIRNAERDKAPASLRSAMLAIALHNYETIGAWKDLISTLRRIVSISKQGNLHIYAEDDRIPSKLEKYLQERKIDVFLRHPLYMEAFLTALSIADDEEPCLIIGETGTGKDEIAKAIHRFSRRRENNFQTVNVAGITDTIFKSEISGTDWRAASDIGTHLGAFLKCYGREEYNDKERRKETKWGYYVDYNKNLKGKIRFIRNVTEGRRYVDDASEEDIISPGGTLFLDEIDSLPGHLQPTLLRILQEKEVQVQGEDKTRGVNIKIVCAAGKDPLESIRNGDFRRDLYYRISRGIVELPPLRAAKEAIPEFAQYELNKIARKMHYKDVIKLTKKARDKLQRYDWPGNVRELQNILYRAVDEMEKNRDQTITDDYIKLRNESASQEYAIDATYIDLSKVTYDEMNRRYIKYLKMTSGGNVSKAARLANIPRGKMRYIQEKFGEEE